MKPLAGYIGYNSEWRELAQVISRVIKKKENLTVFFFNYFLIIIVFF